MMNEEIAHGMVCFFHQKKHSYLIFCIFVFFVLLVGVFGKPFSFSVKVFKKAYLLSYVKVISIFPCTPEVPERMDLDSRLRPLHLQLQRQPCILD
jgi:hypothetical protein